MHSNQNYLMSEPIQHIFTFQAINKPVALELCNLIDKISSKLSSDEKEKLVSYYGFENIFGSSYWEGFQIEENN